MISSKFVRALEAQAAVWMFPVVELPPLLDQDFGFSQAQKNLTVQAFIAKAVVETLDVAVLPRASWLTMSERL